MNKNTYKHTFGDFGRPKQGEYNPTAGAKVKCPRTGRKFSPGLLFGKLSCPECNQQLINNKHC